MRSGRNPRGVRRSQDSNGSLLSNVRRRFFRQSARKKIRSLLVVENLEDRRLLAGLVGVDFDQISNSPPNWTSIGSQSTPFTQSNLQDEAGVATPFDLTISGAAGSITAAAAGPVNATTLPIHSSSLANIDGQIFTNVNTVTLTWSDLTAGTNYEVYVFGLEGYYPDIQQDVTITGAGTPVSFLQNFATNNLFINDAVGSSSQPLSAYAKTVTADSNGEIAIQVDPHVLTLDVSLGGLAIREIVAPELTVSIVASSVSEGDGPGATTGIVTRNTDTTAALTVNLSSDDTSEATVPATVTIPAGQVFASFPVDAVDDLIEDGTQTVTITASEAGHASGSDTVDVTDDDADFLTVSIVDGAVLESAGLAATTAIVTRNSDTTNVLTVDLVSSQTGKATVPISVTIPAGQASSAPFDINAVDNIADDGTQSITITASAVAHNDGIGTLIVVDDDVTAGLAIDVAASTISETDGSAATTATVSRLLDGVITNNVSRGTSISDGLLGSQSQTNNTDGTFSSSFSQQNPSNPLESHQVSLNSTIDSGGIDGAGFVSIDTNSTTLSPLSDSSFFDFYFDLTTTSTFTLSGFVDVDSDDADALASIELSGPGLVIPLSFVQTANAVDIGGQTNINETGTLAPGTYHFVARAEASSTGSIPFADAAFDFDLQFAAAALTVNLAGDPSEVELPASVTIGANQTTSPLFNVGAVDDVVVDGDQNVNVIASAPSHVDGSDLVVVTDNDANFSIGDALRVYRIAVAATGEFTSFFAGGVTEAFAAIGSTIDAINAIFEPELAISFDLVSDANVVYANPATDPYSGTDLDAMLDQNQANLDAVVGSANYDIGHVFSFDTLSGGGLAGLGVVGLNGSKGRGATIALDPLSVSFVSTLAHELGHQFGAEHTFNSMVGFCGALGQYESGNAYEVASGSTLMSYAGICPSSGGGDNLQDDSDQVFLSASLHQVQEYITGNAHAAPNSTIVNGNSIPTVNAGLNYTIPAGTPFALTAVGADSDPLDSLSYSWEELDLGPAQSLPVSDNGYSPLFRAFAPTNDPTRIFPRLPDLLNNVDTAAIGEALPTTDRGLNFAPPSEMATVV